MHILKKKKKSVFPEEGRMRRGTLDRRPPPPPHPNLRKEAVISLLVCCALSVKEFQKSQVVDHDFHRPPRPPSPRPQTVAACQRKGGRVALNNTLAFMEMYQMFQE